MCFRLLRRFFGICVWQGFFIATPLLGVGTNDSDSLSQIHLANKSFPDRPSKLQAIVTSVGQSCQILFLGDSLTHFWENREFAPIWEHYYKDRHAINFGEGGDTVNDIRSRLRDTNWGACQPTVTVILAGTNDREDTPTRRAKKTRLLLDEVYSHFPETRVLLISVPPFGADNLEAAQSWSAGISRSYLASNKIIETYADNLHIFYIDITKAMTWKSGVGFSGLGNDHLHFDQLGRMRWAEAMEPTIAKILNTSVCTPLPHPDGQP